MSRSRPVTFLSLEELSKLTTPRLLAYKRRLKETGGGKGEYRWIPLIKGIQKILKERKRELYIKVPWLLLKYDFPGWEPTKAQNRAAKRDAEKFKRRNNNNCLILL